MKRIVAIVLYFMMAIFMVSCSRATPKSGKIEPVELTEEEEAI